jgi:serralysin
MKTALETVALDPFADLIGTLDDSSAVTEIGNPEIVNSSDSSDTAEAAAEGGKRERIATMDSVNFAYNQIVVGDVENTASAAGAGDTEAASTFGDDTPDAPAASDAGWTHNLDQPQENGSGATTVAVAASGNQGIDGLLSGIRWAGSITYSDPNSTADYQATHPEALNGFSQLSAQQMEAVHFGLNSFLYTQNPGAAGFSVEGMTGLTIDYAGSGSGAGTIRVANTTDPGTAYAYYPNNDVYGGDAFFGPSGDFPDVGDYDWHTVLHELGHALGLAHGHTGGAYGALPANLDSLEYSIMTYRTYIGGPSSGGYTYETWGAPQTFMMYDIAALQYMYGANYSINSGNTTYTWDPNNGTTFVNGAVALDPGGNRIFATIWDGGGIDTYDLSNYTTNLSINLAAGGHSTFSSTQLAYLGFDGSNNVYASGNIYNALLYQGNTASLIENAYGGSGNDTIVGNEANNGLIGNDGNDTLAGDLGNDVLKGAAGNDVLKGGGNDTLDGGAGNDTLLGEDGDDQVFGGAGNDNITVGSGDDSADGGDGDDIISRGGGSSLEDEYTGGAGTDTINTDGSGFVDGVVFDMTAGYLILNGSNYEVWSAFENYDGSTGTGAEDVLGTAGANLIELGSGNNIANGRGGNDIIYAGAGNDNILGEAGNDQLFGQDGNDILVGGLGADALDGGTGTDYASYVNATAGVLVDFLFAGSNTGEAAGDTYVSIENIDGSGFNDSLRGDNLVNIIAGQNGNDALFGRGGADQLFGGNGNDTLIGGTQADLLFGGAGSDVASYFQAAAGLRADLSNAATNTGEAVGDVYNLIEGLVGSTFGDVLVGNAGNNVLAGYIGSDQMFGNNGNDNMYGSVGDDFIGGGANNDSLFGGDGADTLFGGANGDQMFGGNNNDIFLYTATTDSTAGAGQTDVILDFTQGQDIINLAGIDAITGGVDDMFSYIGTALFTNVAGQLRFNTATATLFGDVNGDAVADFQVIVAGTGGLPLNLADFVL